MNIGHHLLCSKWSLYNSYKKWRLFLYKRCRHMLLEKFMSCCKWRICFLSITNFMTVYVDCSGYPWQSESRIQFCQTRFHKSHTFTKNNCTAIDEKASKTMVIYGLRSMNRLLKPLNSHNSWYFSSEVLSASHYRMVFVEKEFYGFYIRIENYIFEKQMISKHTGKSVHSEYKV